MNEYLLDVLNNQGSYMAAATAVLAAGPFAGWAARVTGLWLYRRALKVNCRCERHRGGRR